MEQTNELQDSVLRDRLDALQAADPRLRLIEAATQLAVPEARLFLARTGLDIVRLTEGWVDLAKALSSLGPVIVHLDTKVGIHRKHMQFGEVGAADITAIARGEGGELRMLLSRWNSAWAVCSKQVPGAPEGLHIFDRHGDSALRILLDTQTDRKAWGALVGRLRAPLQQEALNLEPVPLPASPAEGEHDAQAFRELWSSLRDVRDFYRLMRSWNLTREQAYQLVGPAYAQRLRVQGVQEVLERLARDEVPVSLALGNRAAIQVHMGAIECVGRAGHLLTILDPLHTAQINTRAMRGAWVVRRNGLEGMQTVVEVLTDYGDVAATLRPAELDDWRWRRAVEHALLNWKA